MSDRPQLLYKYRSLDGDALGRVRASIITKQIWLSRPADFNDPFDCAPVVMTTWDKPGIQFTAKRAAERRTRGRSRTDRRLEMKKLTQGVYRRDTPTLQAAQRVAQETIDRIRESMGVLSLAADPFSVLMWSHYASQHTGMVMTFRTTNGDLFTEAQEVVYESERPVVDLVGDRENTMEKMLLHKAKYWEYEHEWRVVRTGQPGLHAFDPESLVAIVFGARAREDDKRSIRQAVSIAALNVKFGQARFDDKMFRLDIEHD